MNRIKDHISVCICTFKRPDLLKCLLEKIKNQITENYFSFSIVIVDNDAAQSAKEVAEYFKKNNSISFEYYCEPEQNISLARNKALENAKGNYIALLDDDEIPDDNWLLIMLRACSELDADGVQGRVLSLYEESTPEWVIKGGFYERPDFQTGSILEWKNGLTGNLIFKKKLLEENKIIFRPEFGSGGEDRDFFRRMIAKGYIFKHCHESVVYEYVPPMRWKRSFMIRRALLRGKMAVQQPNFSTLSVLKSILALSLYSISLPFLFIAGHHLFMKYLVKSFDHLGKILSACNFNIIKQKYVTE